MISTQDLTAEQRAVVRHSQGPAAVLAVPGAGKTTAIVHRIRHLVENCGVPPERILASSFNRSTVQSLVADLRDIGIEGVDTRTLHSLGRRIARASRTAERTASPTNEEAPSPDAAAHRLARRALQARAEERDLHVRDLDISPSDVVDQVAAWKQTLSLPDPDRLDLPESVRETVQTATHENEEYVELYRRFETIRARNGWTTYPDMVWAGWASLARDADVRSRWRQRYDHVIVDEFQDVSRAQFRLLRLLTTAGGTLMAVGDDDQCIYQWRGADPSFLLDMAKRDAVTEYVMRASFRLPASPLVLANATIRQNDRRRSKRIRLTQGFRGSTTIVRADTPADGADALTDRLQRLQAEEGYSLDEICVLLRTYGQSPPLERALIDRTVPYRIVGHEPFYRRPSVQTLLRYLYWGVLERRRRTKGFEHERTARQYAERFEQIANRPNRYIPRDLVDLVARRARTTEDSIPSLLEDHRSGLPEDTAETVGDLIDVLEHLADRVACPAQDTLSWLIDAIDYTEALRRRSRTPTQGAMRVRTVEALVDLASETGSVPALLQRVRSLASAAREASASRLSVRSIHRAKGKEWPVVLVPDCNDDVLPLETDASTSRPPEEERRLFYVALTRAREQLYLGVSAPGSPSPFLKETDADARLPHCRNVQTALRTEPDTLSPEALALLCQGVAELDVEYYIREWWIPDPSYARALNTQLRALGEHIEAARARLERYREARRERQRARSDASDEVGDQIETLRDRIGDRPFPSNHRTPDLVYPEDALFTFAWAEDETEIRVRWDGRTVALVDPFGVGALDAETVLDLPWPALVGRFDGLARNRRRLHFTIDWTATERQLIERRRNTISLPDPPDETTRLLARETVEEGRSLLVEGLQSWIDGD